MRGLLQFLVLLGFSIADLVDLTMQNHDQVLSSSQVVFVAFCADWCFFFFFSRQLKPIFEEAAEVFNRENPQASVTWAVVDSVQQDDVRAKYFVNKFPTMKVFVNGELIHKEYRSSRSVEALTNFVKSQLSPAINEFSSQQSLESIMAISKRNIVAWFKKDGEEYTNLKKIASLLREECTFWVSDASISGSLNENKLTFVDPDTNEEQKFTGNFGDYDFMKQWVTDKCIPLVREVTFENVEELTEDGLPFLLFFRDPKDKEADRLFTQQVFRELSNHHSFIKPLLADGHKFAHPLRHLGKTAKDLPVLAIDSFQHMFLFPDMSQLTVSGKLREFVMNLPQLHAEFHKNLDKKVLELANVKQNNSTEEQNVNSTAQAKVDAPTADPITTPPPSSVFKELKPSEKRYSILQKTELEIFCYLFIFTVVPLFPWI